MMCMCAAAIFCFILLNIYASWHLEQLYRPLAALFGEDYWPFLFLVVVLGEIPPATPQNDSQIPASNGNGLGVGNYQGSYWSGSGIVQVGIPEPSQSAKISSNPTSSRGIVLQVPSTTSSAPGTPTTPSVVDVGRPLFEFDATPAAANLSQFGPGPTAASTASPSGDERSGNISHPAQAAMLLVQASQVRAFTHLLEPL